MCSLIDNIYTNIPESDVNISEGFKTHINDHYSFFSVHGYIDKIISHKM